MRLSRLTFLVSLLTFTMLWSADINTTLVNGNKVVYQKLLSTLSQENNNTSQTPLEKSLLKMLIDNFEQVEIFDQKQTPPQNADAYKALFTQYIYDAIQVSALKNKLIQSQNKISAIEKEIRSFDKNNSKILTFELQDALYEKNRIFYKKQISLYQVRMQEISKLLVSSLKSITIESDSIVTDMKKKKLLAQNLSNQISKLQVDREQAELLNDKKKTASIDKKIKELQKLYDKTLINVTASQFLLFSSGLKAKDDSTFSLAKDIKKELESLKQIEDVNHYFMPLLQSMSREYLGPIKTITGAGKQEVKVIMYKGWSFISQPIFTINETPISILKLILTLLVFIIGFILGAYYKRKINALHVNKDSFTASTRTILANIGYYIIVVIAFFMALNVLGIKLSSIALVAGALSVGIGFGLKNIVSNFVSGLILMFERSIKIGDYVQLDENTVGYVTDIRMRSTTINTNENIDVIVPNQNFIENRMVNWTMNDQIRRFEIPFGVRYGTDARKVIEVVKKAVMDSGYGDVYSSDRHKTRVVMTEMGESSVNFELFVWIQGEEIRYPRITVSRFLILIYNALNDNNIEIPFPQRDLHIRSMESNVQIAEEK